MTTPLRHDGSPSSQEDAPLPGRPSDANRTGIIIQHNYIAEGVTINISSSNSYGSTVTKLEYAAPKPAEPTSLQHPLTRQLAPVEYDRESIVISGNTFGEHMVINIASPYSTGAEIQELYDSLPLVKQTALLSPGRTRNRTKSRAKNFSDGSYH
ncbi:hypothetical protein F4604DRAFT_1898623 [Suillus subluteus]|nr:hypothetical protein F4604DRAFT_1898623 [Suillus subluteus]